jgi:hypothetical protein
MRVAADEVSTEALGTRAESAAVPRASIRGARESLGARAALSCGFNSIHRRTDGGAGHDVRVARHSARVSPHADGGRGHSSRGRSRDSRVREDAGRLQRPSDGRSRHEERGGWREDGSARLAVGHPAKSSGSRRSASRGSCYEGSGRRACAARRRRKRANSTRTRFDRTGPQAARGHVQFKGTPRSSPRLRAVLEIQRRPLEPLEARGLHATSAGFDGTAGVTASLKESRKT